MSRIRTILALMTLVFWGALSSNAAVVKITLLPEVEVTSSGSVFLRDIASIEGPSDIVKRIGDLSIAGGPRPGQTRTVSSNFVLTKIISSRVKAEIKLSGAESVIINATCVKKSADELEDAARNFVISTLPQDNKTYDIIVQRAPRDISVESGKTVEIRPRLMGGRVRPGSNTIILEVVVNGKVAASTTVSLQVVVKADVLVATSPIAKDEQISQKNTTWEQRDITYMNDAFILIDDGNLEGRIATRSIQAGNVIRNSDIKFAPVIKKGDIVSLTVKCGSVTLRTTAEAKEDGRISDNIKVKASISKEDVMARVVDNSTVEIIR